jgi:pyruvate carboxylase subunit B
MRYTYEVCVDNEMFSVSLDGDTILVNGMIHQIDTSFPGAGDLSLLVDGNVSYSCVEGGESAHPLSHVVPGNPFQINVDGHTHDVLVEDRRSLLIKTLRKSQAGTARSTVVAAPMPGLVAKVMVSEGEQVTNGQGVFILEAMKMENEIRAPQSGLIEEILVRPGQAVEKGQILAKFGAGKE